MARLAPAESVQPQCGVRGYRPVNRIRPPSAIVNGLGSDFCLLVASCPECRVVARCGAHARTGRGERASVSRDGSRRVGRSSGAAGRLATTCPAGYRGWRADNIYASGRVPVTLFCSLLFLGRRALCRFCRFRIQDTGAIAAAGSKLVAAHFWHRGQSRRRISSPLARVMGIIAHNCRSRPGPDRPGRLRISGKAFFFLPIRRFTGLAGCRPGRRGRRASIQLLVP